jgi:glutaminyl-tRNA synthetase
MTTEFADPSRPLAGGTRNFIVQIVEQDLQHGRNGGRVVTRFPPEPNGYLHAGHAKSICLNFGMVEEFPGALCRLRYDDTNPLKENPEFVQSIEADVCWLTGHPLSESPRFTSSYFDALYAYAEQLILAGVAYVCDLSGEEIRVTRGTLSEPGQESPYRGRTIDENLTLFRQMRAGAFADGSRVLRARIDMASPNINMRDPVLYRIRRATHHQTGDTWCIYPTYDYSHCLADAIEGVTHSLCTLEFEDHRPLYDWILDQLGIHDPRPRQIEFARLSLEYTVLSKRRLTLLVTSGAVAGWDDPRMPTLAGFRRRGYPPAAIREFCRRIGVAKADNRVTMEILDHCIRDELERTAPRAMGVLYPLKVVLEDWPQERVEWIEAARHPQDATLGTRTLPMTREIFIDREDFRIQASKEFKRLTPGEEVRLRHSYVIRCREVITDPQTGDVVALHCTHDPDTLASNPVGRKVRGVIHWVSATHGCQAGVRLYDRLFTRPDADALSSEEEFLGALNPESMTLLDNVWVEPALQTLEPGATVQFERVGFFCVDQESAAAGRLTLNRTVTLRDSWSKLEKRGQGG